MIGVMIVFGLILVTILTVAMWRDGRRRAKLVTPSPEEQPHQPDHREHVEEIREQDGEDSFPHDGGRLLPYNLRTHSTHSTGKGRESRPKHGPNAHSGSFGSGGLGG
ncbi:DUF6479 family protein [Streptomyces sp. NPDC004609]|uniref:DUF6479 family protein n=1 Tax=Streptomyces sp. NPDC004609 TaxID=3364704 RepID=UPI0036AB570E